MYNKQDLASKIDWEGGIWDALEYGITYNDIEDKDLSFKWLQLEHLFKTCCRLRDQIIEMLPEPAC